MNTSWQFVFIIWLVCSFTACKPGSGPPSQHEEKRKIIPSDFSVTLEMNPLHRGECDLCIRYKLFIFADGTVIYDGIDMVKKLGAAKSTLTPEKLDTLVNAFEKSGYENFLDKYDVDEKVCDERWTDSPITILVISMNGKTKSIVHYWGCRGPKVPLALTEIEEQILNLTAAKQWIGEKDEISEAKRNPTLYRPKPIKNQ